MATIFTDLYGDGILKMFLTQQSVAGIRSLLARQAPAGFITVNGAETEREYLINVTHIVWVEE